MDTNTNTLPPAGQIPGVGSDGLLGSVWIVVGETGVYSDYSEWNVAAYPNEEEANKHRDAAQAEAEKVNGKDYTIRNGFKNAYDSQFASNYTGTHYRVEMVELHSAFLPNTQGLVTPGTGQSAENAPASRRHQ